MLAVVSTAVLQDRRLTMLDRTHYAVLSAHADSKTAVTFVSRERVAAELGVTVTAVTRSRKRLEESGHIARVAGGFRGMTTRILITAWLGKQRDRARAAVAAARRASERNLAALLAGLRRQERVTRRTPVSGTPRPLSVEDERTRQLDALERMMREDSAIPSAGRGRDTR